MKDKERLQKLANCLTKWYPDNARDLPWRRDRDPYHVWLSEIMLQQTRVEAVREYYLRFLKALPTVKDLAEVPDDRLMKLWQGLGYYTRARNLKKAAALICNEYGGKFPTTYESVRALPGVGDYTAGAVSSICYDLSTPAVDGNVLRVYSRIQNDFAEIDKDATKKAVRTALTEVYKKENACVLTQAFMELGACVCVPNGAPKCEACPAADFCLAKKKGTIEKLPVRSEKKKRKVVELQVLLLVCGDKIAIKKRPEKGLLAGMWEFPNYEGPVSETSAAKAADELFVKPLRILFQTSYAHIFTHVEWHMTAYCFTCDAMPDTLIWVTAAELEETFALPSAFMPFANSYMELYKQDQGV